MSDDAPRINAYRCRSCAELIVTIDRAEGVTPFMIGCEAKGCGGMAESAFYRVPPGYVPSHEWYRPTLKWARRKGPAVLEHVKMGGLWLRPIAGVLK